MQLERNVFYVTRQWKQGFAIMFLFTLPFTLAPDYFIALIWLRFGFPLLTVIFPAIGILLGAAFLDYLLAIRPVRCIVTSTGIAFYCLTYRIYTPWSNVRGIGTSQLGIYHPPALLFWQPAVEGKVKENVQSNEAVIQRRRWLTSKDNPSADALPLIFVVVAKNWQESELGMSIRRYVPHIFQNTEE